MRAWHETYGLPVVVSLVFEQLRPMAVRPRKSFLIPLVTVAAFDQKPLPVYGKGENVRDWLHVEEDHWRGGRCGRY